MLETIEGDIMEQEQEKQAVAETDAQAVPETEETGARDDGDNLDTLLSEFESETVADSKPEQAGGEETLRTEFDELKRQFAEQQFAGEIKPVIAKVRGDIPENLMSDDEIFDLLDGKAKRDPRFAKAFDDRQSKPHIFDKILEKYSEEIGAKFAALPDAQATEDREAVAHAVRGASTQAPASGSPPDYSHMSDAEYREKITKEYGFTPL